MIHCGQYKLESTSLLILVTVCSFFCDVLVKHSDSEFLTNSVWALLPYNTHTHCETCTSFTLVTEIRINWFTFNLEEHDQKSVDLIHYFGEPFPPDDSETAMATACDGEGNESPLITTCESDKLSLVKVILKPHEGIPSKKPFSIHPKQLVLLLKNPFVLVLYYIFLCRFYLRIIIKSCTSLSNHRNAYLVLKRCP